MDYLNERWCKLYTRIDGPWLRLPVSARGLFDELHKYANAETGLVTEYEDDPGAEVARMLAARSDEYQRIAADVELLERGGYVETEAGCLYLVGFSEAQERRSRNAVRQARHREREKRERILTHDSNADVTPERDANVQRIESNRSESNRSEIEKKHTSTEPPNGSLFPSSASPRFDFDPLFARYPRREGKAAGMGKLKAKIKTQADFERFTRAIANYEAKVAAEGTERQYTLLWSTFCNGRWEDYVDSPQIAIREAGESNRRGTTPIARVDHSVAKESA